MDVRTALREAIARLRAADTPSYTLAAELLLMHSLGRDRTSLYTHPEAGLDPAQADTFFGLVLRRAAGEPTQYLTGKQEFWGLEFEVAPVVLIPRPETEHVMEVALDRLGPRGIKIRLDTGEPSPPLLIADVGTGSGCLAVALAWEMPHAKIVATDISAAAIEVANRNAARHSVADRIHFVKTNLLENVVHQTPVANHASLGFDLIVSNPPYVGRSEAATLAREVRDYEPGAALFGGPTGVEIYPELVVQAGALLVDGGIFVLELGYNAADHVRAIFSAQPGWLDIRITNDLAGIPRVLSAVRLRG